MSTRPEFDFDTIVDRGGTWSLKWDRYRGRDVIPMWVADMDFRSAPAIVDALRRRVDHGVFGYVEPGPELVEAIEKTENLRVVLIETPANPTLMMTDIRQAVEAAGRRAVKPLVMVTGSAMLSAGW